MDGTLKKRINSKGKTIYDVYYRCFDPSIGKKKQFCKRGFKTQREAKEYLNQIQNSSINGTFIKENKITFKEYAEEWLSIYAEPHLQETTIESYKNQLNMHIYPFLGGLQLKQLTPIHLDKFYKEKLKNGRLNTEGGLSNRSVLYLHRIIHEILEHAVKKQIIPINISNNATPPKAVRYEAEVLTLAEVKLMFEKLKGNEIELPVKLAAYLGLRRGEVLGLTWNNIDFNNKTITITQQVVQVNNSPVITTPKTDGSKRTIFLPDILISNLKEYKTKNTSKLFKNKDLNLIFCNEDGSPLKPINFYNKYKNFLSKNGIKKIRFHDLRHTCATMLLQQGVDIKTISDILGHSTIKITADTYTHVLDEGKKRATDIIATAYNSI